MHPDRRITPLFACLLALLALPTQAVDRMRAGQWETITNLDGKNVDTRSACVPPGEVDFMNGDAASIRAGMEKQLQGACKVKDVKANGDQVVMTLSCAGQESTTTTNYHGDSYDSVSPIGMTIKAKRLGACK